MANQPQRKFSFSIQGFDTDTFHVVRFTGSEGLSNFYQFEITLASDDSDVDFRKAMSGKATLGVSQPGAEDVSWHGVLRGFTQLRRVDGRAYYKAELTPAAWVLTQDMDCRIWLNKDVPQMIRECLGEAGFGNGPDFVVHTSRSYPKRDHICQYNESRHAFLSRWMERNGIYFYFDHSGPKERMIITENMTVHGAHPAGKRLRYSEVSGLDGQASGTLLRSFNHQSRKLPREVLVRDYNYRTPNLDIQAEVTADPDGVGVVYAHGGRIRSPHEALLLANARAQEISCRKDVYFGESDAPFVQPGYVVSVDSHFREDMNQDYLVMEVKHEGSQEGVADAMSGGKADSDRHFYRNAFAAIPASVQYRSPCKAPWPRISGLLNAAIDAEGDGRYAELDEHGRYTVILHFDRSGRKGGGASIPIRMAQPYGGQGHGMHFPLHKGTEVLVGFVEGNPDRPVIVGVAANTAQESVVTSRNQTMANITSAGGNRIHMQDQDGGQNIHLSSPVSSSAIHLGAPQTQDETQPGFTPSQDQKDKFQTLQAQYQELLSAASAYKADQSDFKQGGITLTTNDTLNVKASWSNSIFLIENTQTNVGVYSCNTLGLQYTLMVGASVTVNCAAHTEFQPIWYQMRGSVRQAEAEKEKIIGIATDMFGDKNQLATTVNKMIAEETKSLATQEMVVGMKNAVIANVENTYATKEETTAQKEEIAAEIDLVCVYIDSTVATKEEVLAVKNEMAAEVEQVRGKVNQQMGEITSMAGDVSNLWGVVNVVAGEVGYL